MRPHVLRWRGVQTVSPHLLERMTGMLADHLPDGCLDVMGLGPEIVLVDRRDHLNGHGELIARCGPGIVPITPCEREVN